jgi:2-polyprenyl-3-methyl-5-hydroxy-6-metoxy-1,4-benzoquinol methylase
VTSSASPPTLEFTGERFTPECVREIWYEHWHRYAFALPLARGRRVLDAACGEGFGSAMLAREAASVLGLDLAPQAIAHARARYGDRASLMFREGDCTRLDALSDASFDLITSFETLEHVQEQERMLDGFARLLAPGGILLISTPDKRTYSDLTGFRNEFHVRELYREEFEALLTPRFAARRIFGQKLLFASAIWHDAPGPWAAAIVDAEGEARTTLDYAPLYYLAACAHAVDALDPLPSLSLFGDVGQSVYAHYEDEIRKGIRAGHRIAELEAELAQARARCDALERERR